MKSSSALVPAVAVALALTAVSARAAGWFDESVPRSASLLGGEPSQARFGITLHSLSGTAATEPESVMETDPRVGGANAVQLYGSLDRLSKPQAVLPGYEPPVRRSNVLGVAWQHRLDAADRLSVSAEHGENVSQNLFAQDTAESRAVVSWTRQWGSRLQPSLTGSVFLGDEFARDDNYRQLGRRYLGLAVGGQLTLFKTHTPYLAYQLRRSYYEPDSNTRGSSGNVTTEEALLATRSDDRSMLTAGWRWQMQPNVSMQAEASFGLNADGQDLYNPERSRLFFSTRFDFR